MKHVTAIKSVQIISSDGVEIILPDHLVANSRKLHRKSICGPITLPYTGEELSNIIDVYINCISTGKYPKLSPKEIEILEEMGLEAVYKEQQVHACYAESHGVNSKQKYSLEDCIYDHKPQNNVPCCANKVDTIQNTADLPLVTLKQFLTNDGSDGRRLWILIDTIVFDVTEYLSKHPGGRAPLLKEAGRDSTLQFYQHHGRKGNTRPLFNRLKTLVVGRMSSLDLCNVPGYHKLKTEECGNPSLRKQFLMYFHVIE